MGPAEAEEHQQSPYLAHHYGSLQQQFDAGKLGMWVFLATEILLFGGLFCAYAVYRANHPEIFIYAHRFLDTTLGGVNTIVLICSSLTMAWGVRCAQLGRRRGLVACLILTLLCACGFLGIKYVEYRHKWHEGLLWGTHFDPQTHADAEVHEEANGATADAAAPEAEPAETAEETGSGQLAPPGDERSTIPPAATGPAGLVVEAEPAPSHGILERPSNVHIFFGVYFTMTGLHALHVLAGMTAICWILVRAFKNEFGPDNFLPVDLVGLYWHLVDLVWIFLFPLLYLIH